MASKTSEGQRQLRRNALEKYHTVIFVAGEILFGRLKRLYESAASEGKGEEEVRAELDRVA